MVHLFAVTCVGAVFIGLTEQVKTKTKIWQVSLDQKWYKVVHLFAVTCVGAVFVSVMEQVKTEQNKTKTRVQWRRCETNYCSRQVSPGELFPPGYRLPPTGGRNGHGFFRGTEATSFRSR